MKKYPDISFLFEAKKEYRRRMRRLPIEEKLAIVKQWQEVNPKIERVREQLRAARDAGRNGEKSNE